MNTKFGFPPNAGPRVQRPLGGAPTRPAAGTAGSMPPNYQTPHSGQFAENVLKRGAKPQTNPFPGTKILAAGWLAFAASHLILSSNSVRSFFVQKLGIDEDLYRKGFSWIACGIAAPTTIYYYARARGQGQVIHDIPRLPVARVGIFALRLGALFFFSQAVTRKNPMSYDKEKPKTVLMPRYAFPFANSNQTKSDPTSDDEMVEVFVPPPEAPVIGIHKITRHPILVGAFLWGIAQVCSKVAINDLVFWGPLPVFSVLAGLHQDTRHRKQGLHGATFWQRTSFIPFLRVMEGKYDIPTLIYELNYVSFGVFLLIAAFVRRVKVAREETQAQLEAALRKAIRAEVEGNRKSGGEPPFLQ